MDAIDLLAREDEYKKLNRQLEKKTESLFKEIEQAMQKQDIFSEFSHSLTLSPIHSNTKRHSCMTKSPSSTESTPTKLSNQHKSNVNQNLNTKSISPKIDATEKQVAIRNIEDGKSKNGSNKYEVCNCCDGSKDRINDDLGFLYAFVSVNVQEKLLPASFLKDKVTVEGVCKFLSSKVKLMQEQIDKLQAMLNKKASQCEQHMGQLASLEGERMTCLNRMNGMRASTADSKAKSVALMKKLEEKDRLYRETRSENERLSSEAKRLRSKNANVEARCASQEELIENLKHQIDLGKKAEKDFRDSVRHLSSAHETTISQLEARIKLLCSRTNRQGALIDNLRKQNALLATERATHALERDYSQFILQFS